MARLCYGREHQHTGNSISATIERKLEQREIDRFLISSIKYLQDWPTIRDRILPLPGNTQIEECEI